MDLLRTFIAVDIPPSIQKNIQFTLENLRRAIGNSIRWVPVHNIHLTLKFLGDVSQEKLEGLTEMLRAKADFCPPFELSIGGLGSFPNSKRARVLFIEIQAPAGLEALQREVETASVRLGYDPDPRPFSPHLTIGRVKDHIAASDHQKIHKILEETKIDSLGTARVDSVHLYKSDLKPGGPIYTKLFTAPLKPT